jgi:hypothetical protein
MIQGRLERTGNRPETAMFLLETALILGQEPVEIRRPYSSLLHSDLLQHHLKPWVGTQAIKFGIKL